MEFRQVSSEYFGFPCQFSFHQMLHFSHLSFYANAVGHVWPKFQGIQSQPTLRSKKKIDTIVF
jgi:hypothetical protein